MNSLLIGKILSLLVTSIIFFGCTTPERPESLEELRRFISEPAYLGAKEASPDLALEVERSLANSELAWNEGDLGKARWISMIGEIQAKIVIALSRQHKAELRRADAQTKLQEIQEDIDRLQSQKVDTVNRIDRLRSIKGNPSKNKTKSARSSSRSGSKSL